MVDLGHKFLQVRRDIRTLVANIALHFLGCSAEPVCAHRKELFQPVFRTDYY